MNDVSRSTLSGLIAAVFLAASTRTSESDFALHYVDGDWLCQVGNTSPTCFLGESEGEFRGDGKSPEEAVSNLLVNLIEDRRHQG